MGQSLVLQHRNVSRFCSVYSNKETKSLNLNPDEMIWDKLDSRVKMIEGKKHRDIVNIKMEDNDYDYDESSMSSGNTDATRLLPFSL